MTANRRLPGCTHCLHHPSDRPAATIGSLSNGNVKSAATLAEKHKTFQSRRDRQTSGELLATATCLSASTATATSPDTCSPNLKHQRVVRTALAGPLTPTRRSVQDQDEPRGVAAREACRCHYRTTGETKAAIDL